VISLNLVLAELRLGLKNHWLGYQECHLKPNWLLIHKTSKNQINFARLGTHQQLFTSIKANELHLFTVRTGRTVELDL
jgi:hypothetical protein